MSLAGYPDYDESINDPAAEADYELVLDICRAIRSLVAAYPMILEHSCTVTCMMTQASL